MSRFALRFCFCAAAAIIGAAIADPCLESASNAGWFGPGSYTDHSTWDVVPALVAGLALAVIALLLRIHAVLAQTASKALESGIARLVPVTFALQMLALYAMETTEQQVIYRHTLGGTIWLGAPIAISVCSHALLCTFVVLVGARLLAACAEATVRIMDMVRACAILPARTEEAAFALTDRVAWKYGLAGNIRPHGERAPPYALA